MSGGGFQSLATLINSGLQTIDEAIFTINRYRLTTDQLRKELIEAFAMPISEDFPAETKTKLLKCLIDKCKQYRINNADFIVETQGASFLQYAAINARSLEDFVVLYAALSDEAANLDNFKNNLLIYALRNQSGKAKDIALFILSKHPELAKQPEGSIYPSPLHYACCRSKLGEVIDKLLELGANPKATFTKWPVSRLLPKEKFMQLINAYPYQLYLRTQILSGEPLADHAELFPNKGEKAFFVSKPGLQHNMDDISIVGYFCSTLEEFTTWFTQQKELPSLTDGSNFYHIIAMRCKDIAAKPFSKKQDQTNRLKVSLQIFDYVITKQSEQSDPVEFLLKKNEEGVTPLGYLLDAKQYDFVLDKIFVLSDVRLVTELIKHSINNYYAVFLQELSKRFPKLYAEAIKDIDAKDLETLTQLQAMDGEYVEHYMRQFQDEIFVQPDVGRIIVAAKPKNTDTTNIIPTIVINVEDETFSEDLVEFVNNLLKHHKALDDKNITLVLAARAHWCCCQIKVYHDEAGDPHAKLFILDSAAEYSYMDKELIEALKANFESLEIYRFGGRTQVTGNQCKVFSLVHQRMLDSLMNGTFSKKIKPIDIFSVLEAERGTPNEYGDYIVSKLPAKIMQLTQQPTWDESLEQEPVKSTGLNFLQAMSEYRKKLPGQEVEHNLRIKQKFAKMKQTTWDYIQKFKNKDELEQSLQPYTLAGAAASLTAQQHLRKS